MKKYHFLLLLFVSCNTKQEMSLDELNKATWSKIDNGISYLSVEKTKTGLLDSIRYTFKWFQDSNSTVSELPHDSVASMFNDFLDEKIKDNLKNSKRGYLKLDFFEMMKPRQISISIYLSALYDTLKLAEDIAFIKKIPFVDSVRYISNEVAKQKFLKEAENEEWSQILKDSPLPASIDVELHFENYNSDWLEKFKSIIKSRITNVDDISYPAQYLEEKEKKIWYILYERY